MILPSIRALTEAKDELACQRLRRSLDDLADENAQNSHAPSYSDARST
jgi:hypothetical protein